MIDLGNLNKSLTNRYHFQSGSLELGCAKKSSLTMANQNANPNPNLGPPFNLIKGNEVGIHQVKHIFSSEMLQIEIHPDHPDRQHDLIRPGRLRWTRR